MQLSKSWVALAALALGGCVDSDKKASFDAGVGGTVTGLSGEVTLVLNGGESLRVSANGAFNFSTRVPAEASYSVTIGSQPASQICSVAGGSGTMPYASINSVVVSCATRRHAVGGNISGLIGSLTLSNGADSYTTSTDGPFAFAMPVAEGATYAVSVHTPPATQTCSVNNGAGTMGTSAVDSVVVVCSTNTFAVGGSVSGLVGEVVLQNNGGDPITLSSNGSFEFPAALAQGSAYAVTVQTQPATQTCSVNQGTGAVGAGDVSNVAVVCSINTFNVGGTVSGLVGTVVLQNNGGDNLALNGNGAFTFPSGVAHGSAYAVSVLTQPASYTCVVSNGSGATVTSDVTNVGVTCSLNSTTLSIVNPIEVIPVNGSRSLVVLNTGGAMAVNIAAALPPGWTSVVSDVSDCANLAAGDWCSLTFSSTVPYVAQDGIAITADNVSSPPTVALAFSIDGFQVVSVDSASTATVVDNVDADYERWSILDVLAGATSLTDGAANTTDALVLGINGRATIACYNSTSGGAVMGTWYLPAVCQLTNVGGWASCPTGHPNLSDNLFRRGFGPPADYYWSSTEVASDEAWVVHVDSDASETSESKLFVANIRCMRSISY